MTTTKSFLVDSAARHTVFVQRFAGGQSKEMLPSVERVRKEANRRLREEDLTSISRKRLTKLEKDLAVLVSVIYTDMGTNLKKNMAEFAEYEAGFSARMFENATDMSFTVPSATVVANAAANTAMDIKGGKRGQTVAGALNQFSDKKAKQIVRIVNDGVIAGKTTQEVAKEITIVTRTLQAAQVTALARTIVNHTSSEARESTMRANKDIIRGVEWVSVLDGRTTSICGSLDGQEFKIGEGPRPPIHWGCRSTTIPVVKKEFSVIPTKDASKRPAVGADGTEQVKGNTTYNSWIKKQPETFQDDVLGATRGKLLRDGNLNMDKFVDNNYKELSLKELKRKEPAAFERAGIK